MNDFKLEEQIPGTGASSPRADRSRFARPFHSWGRWELLALVVWIAIVAGITIRVLASPRWNSVYPIFAEAGRHWRGGAELYRIPSHPYRYSPLVAVGFVPFSLLPDRIGAAVWLLLNAAVYLGALSWWCRTALPGRPDGGAVPPAREQALLFLLIVPLSVGSLNNGQSNALILGLILAAVTSVVRERWTLAGVCLALATLFKIYPLAIGLLLAVLCGRRIIGRLAIALVIGLALPFCFQGTAYVWSQYGSWLGNLAMEDRQLTSVEFWYRDLRLLFQVCHAPLSSWGYRVIELITGAGMAGLCFLASRRTAGKRHRVRFASDAVHWALAIGRWILDISSKMSNIQRPMSNDQCREQQQVLVTLLALGCCWMTALGLATESCTYVLLAPSLSWALVDAFSKKEPLRWKAALLASCTVLLLAQIAVWLPGGLGRRIHSYGLQPAAALLFLLYVVLTTLRDFRVSGSVSAARPIFREAA